MLVMCFTIFFSISSMAATNGYSEPANHFSFTIMKLEPGNVSAGVAVGKSDKYSIANMKPDNSGFTILQSMMSTRKTKNQASVAILRQKPIMRNMKKPVMTSLFQNKFNPDDW